MLSLIARTLSLLLFLFAGSTLAAEGKLTVHFLDVEQGDAALIVSPTGKTVLVDGGPPSATPALVKRVSELVKAPIDLVILTHPHLDHLGGLVEVIGAVGAKRFLDPGFDHASKSYAELLEFLKGRADVITPERDPDDPQAEMTIGLGEGASITVLWPRRPVEPFFRDTRSDPNSNSIVFRLQHGANAFLFTGDSEAETEERLEREAKTRNVTVLKVAHHGSRHSSTASFLRVAQPKFAVISAGTGNDYGHPSPETLERLTDVGAKVFRTDLQGEVTVVSDGKSVSFTTARSASAEALLVGAEKPGRGHHRPSRKPAESTSWTPPPPPADAPQLADGGTDWKAYAATVNAAGGEAKASQPSAHYVASKRAPDFHREDCRFARRIAKKDRLVFQSRTEAAQSRSPAEDCSP